MILEAKLRIPYGTQAGSTSLLLKVQTNIEHMERGGTPGSFFPAQLFWRQDFLTRFPFMKISRTLPLNPSGKARGSFKAPDLGYWKECKDRNSVFVRLLYVET